MARPSGRNLVLIVLGALLVAALVVGVSVYGYVNKLRNDGIRQENNLTATYNNNQNVLSSVTLTVQETLGVADRNSERLEEILTSAVQGRYGEMTPGTGGEMFSAITEAYPDLTISSEAYTRVQDAVISGRAEFKGQQSLLLDKIQAFDNWREEGFLRSSIVSSLGFPSDRLVARGANGESLYGQEALNKMRQLVLDERTVGDFESGTTEPLISPNEDY